MHALTTTDFMKPGAALGSEPWPDGNGDPVAGHKETVGCIAPWILSPPGA
jgi:hypothetical protein